MATLFIGQNKVFLPETDSTNSYAINLLKNVNCIEGTVVYTDNQTQGKGQRGNTWHSESSMNITLSLILKPHFLASKNIFYLSKITSLALYDVLTECLGFGQFDIKIKWPNDMLVNRKKIAGVLIENSLLDNKINWSIIGIGFNVNQMQFAGLDTATSLKLLDQDHRSLDKIMDSIFIHFEKWYLKLKQNHLAEIDENYHNFLFGMHREMTFQSNGIQINAFVEGVSPEGLLRLRNENNHEQLYNMKEIAFVI